MTGFLCLTFMYLCVCLRFCLRLSISRIWTIPRRVCCKKSRRRKIRSSTNSHSSVKWRKKSPPSKRKLTEPQSRFDVDLHHFLNMCTIYHQHYSAITFNLNCLEILLIYFFFFWHNPVYNVYNTHYLTVNKGGMLCVYTAQCRYPGMQTLISSYHIHIIYILPCCSLVL